MIHAHFKMQNIAMIFFIYPALSRYPANSVCPSEFLHCHQSRDTLQVCAPLQPKTNFCRISKRFLRGAYVESIGAMYLLSKFLCNTLWRHYCRRYWLLEDRCWHHYCAKQQQFVRGELSFIADNFEMPILIYSCTD